MALAATWGLWTGDRRGLLPLALGAVATTTLVLVATLLHLDRFHFGVAEPGPLVAAWVWLIVYLIVPPLLGLLWLRELRAGTAFAAGGVPVPLRRWVRLGLASVSALVGVSRWSYSLAWHAGLAVDAHAVDEPNDGRVPRGHGAGPGRAGIRERPTTQPVCSHRAARVRRS